MKTTGSKRIAGRYVRALFEVAESASALGDVEKDLASLGNALVESEEFRNFLTNPLLTRGEQASAVEAILTRMKAGKTTKQFLAMLSERKRLAILPDIIVLFAEMAARARGELAATLIAAAALKSKDTAAVADRLGKAYGKKVHLDVEQDKSLLGGMILKIGSLQLDGSLSGKLRRLKNALAA